MIGVAFTDRADAADEKQQTIIVVSHCLSRYDKYDTWHEVGMSCHYATKLDI